MLYFNGKIISPEAVKISPSDRGLLLSDGLFETMKVREGRVFDLKQHWERLQGGAEYLGIALSMTFYELEKIIYELLKQNHLLTQDASLRLTVTRGSGPRGLLPPTHIEPTIMLTAAALSAQNDALTSLKIVSIRRNELSPLANIKSLNYLDNVLARVEAVKSHASEALLLNSKGKVAEASAANIFLVSKSDDLLTPRLLDGALPGVTRQIVINLAKELGLAVEEAAISVDELKQAKEIFLTNSLIEIQPVNKVEDIILLLREGSITRKLHEAYQEEVKKHKLRYPKSNMSSKNKLSMTNR